MDRDEFWHRFNQLKKEAEKDLKREVMDVFPLNRNAEPSSHYHMCDCGPDISIKQLLNYLNMQNTHFQPSVMPNYRQNKDFDDEIKLLRWQKYQNYRPQRKDEGGYFNLKKSDESNVKFRPALNSTLNSNSRKSKRLAIQKKWRILIHWAIALNRFTKKWSIAQSLKKGKNLMDFAAMEIAEKYFNLAIAKYKTLCDQIREISLDGTDFLIKDSGITSIFQKKIPKQKQLKFADILQGFVEIITSISFKNTINESALKEALVKIIDKDQTIQTMLWDTEKLLFDQKQDESVVVLILYLVVVKGLIFNSLLSAQISDKSAVEEHNIRALCYILFRTVRTVNAGSESAILEVDSQFRKGIQAWTNSSDIANQWNDSTCKQIFKLFEGNIKTMAESLGIWGSSVLKDFRVKENDLILPNIDTVVESQ